MMNVAIVDDHKIFRSGLKTLLEKMHLAKIVAEASNGQDFLEIIRETGHIELVFMDINMPVMDGVQATCELKKEFPEIKILALTSYEDSEHLNAMLEAGADGYILKSAEAQEFVQAIEKISQGKPYFSDDILSVMTRDMQHKPAREHKLPHFTRREEDVLRLLCQGMSNQKIGEALNISDRTVERHKTNLLEKTETENTLNLVIFAIKNKLVEI
jgi:DNA-binding NarL/FixJ family response regulator